MTPVLSVTKYQKRWNIYLLPVVITIDLRTIMLGWRTADPPILDNFILLSAKSYIFRCKVCCKLPRVREYKEILASCFLVERLCYLKYKKNKSFLDKLSTLRNWLSQSTNQYTVHHALILCSKNYYKYLKT